MQAKKTTCQVEIEEVATSRRIQKKEKGDLRRRESIRER